MKTEEIQLPDPMEMPKESIAPVITRLSGLQMALAARLIGAATEQVQGEFAPDPAVRLSGSWAILQSGQAVPDCVIHLSMV